MSGEIVPLTPELLDVAACVHSASWQASHRAFCSEAFVAAHTLERQRAYLLARQREGCRFFVMMEDGACRSLVSECDGLIENLYVDPAHWREGIGSRLLAYAGALHLPARLFVLSNNAAAIACYEKAGYRFTGRENRLNDGLAEREMIARR